MQSTKRDFFLSISDGKITSNLHGRGTVSSTGEFRLQNPADSRPTRLGKASFLHYKAESSLPCARRNTMILELASMLSRVAVRFGHRTGSTPLPRTCTRDVAGYVCNNFVHQSLLLKGKTPRGQGARPQRPKKAPLQSLSK